MLRVSRSCLPTVLILLFVLCLAGTSAVQGQGNLNALLHGDYSFTQSRHCFDSFTPWGPNFQLLDGGFPSRLADSGVIHYNGDGTGTVTFRSVNVALGGFPGSFPISENQGTCSLAYAVHPDGSVAQVANCTGHIVVGFNVGTTVTVTGIPSQRQITQGNTLLLIETADPLAVETVTITPPGGPSQTRYRVCTRTGVAAKP